MACQATSISEHCCMSICSNFATPRVSRSRQQTLSTSCCSLLRPTQDPGYDCWDLQLLCCKQHTRLLDPLGQLQLSLACPGLMSPSAFPTTLASFLCACEQAPIPAAPHGQCKANVRTEDALYAGGGTRKPADANPTDKPVSTIQPCSPARGRIAAVRPEAASTPSSDSAAPAARQASLANQRSPHELSRNSSAASISANFPATPTPQKAITASQLSTGPSSDVHAPLSRAKLPKHGSFIPRRSDPKHNGSLPPTKPQAVAPPPLYFGQTEIQPASPRPLPADYTFPTVNLQRFNKKKRVKTAKRTTTVLRKAGRKISGLFSCFGSTPQCQQ